MTVKIFSALKRILKLSQLFQSNRKKWQSKLHYTTLPSQTKESQEATDRPRSPNYGTIKLATYHITPKLRLLSFRADRNHLYFSLARTHTDLVEFKELFDEDVAA